MHQGLNKVMIDIESINLVFNSECIKEYPKVRYILWEFKEKKKSILYGDIEHLRISDEETYTLLRYGFKEIRDLASSEWIQEKYAGEHKSYCELCLQPNLRYNYVIKNKFNNNRMIVGSSCIDKFSNIDSTYFNIKQHKRDLPKQKQRIERTYLLNKEFPNCEADIRKWEEYYDKLLILMPYEIDNRFQKLILESKAFRNNFIEGKIKEDNVYEFKQYYKEFEELKNLSREFVKVHKEDRYSATRELGKWLVNQGLGDIRQEIVKANGKITKATIGRIYYYPFIDSILEEIEQIFWPLGFECVACTDENISFKYSYNDVVIEFKQSLQEFMKYFGRYLFDPDQLATKDILKHLELDWEARNVQRYVNILNNILYETLYYIEVDTYEGQLIISKDTAEEEQSTIPHKVFLRNNQVLLEVKDIKVAQAKLTAYMYRLKNWTTSEERRKYQI